MTEIAVVFGYWSWHLQVFESSSHPSITMYAPKKVMIICFKIIISPHPWQEEELLTSSDNPSWPSSPSCFHLAVDEVDDDDDDADDDDDDDDDEAMTVATSRRRMITVADNDIKNVYY